MTSVTFIILIAGLIMLARSALFWLYFIQTKDNRLERIWMEMKSRNFWRLFFSRHRIVMLALFILLMMGLWSSDASGGSPNTAMRFFGYLVMLYIMLYALATVFVAVRKRLRVPRATRKFSVLLSVILILELLAIYYFRLGALLAVELFQPFIVVGIFALAYTPNIFLHRYFINQARKKIAAHKNLIVIGITGSYGKTTTKEFLAHILSKKYKVLKTPAHINVDTGVAKVILNQLSPPSTNFPLLLKEGPGVVLAKGGYTSNAPTTPSHPPLIPPSGRGGEPQVFIVEMGAYKKGEIKKICDLVCPKYALMTGLSDQHLALFGSLNALREAKFELVEAVSGPAGHIIANADSEPLVQEFKRRRIMPVWYGINSHAARFKPADIVFGEEGTAFTVHGVKFRTPAIGAAALNNLLGAITVAVELGLHLDEIPQLAADLPVIAGTMEIKPGKHGALIIDDTYNANTEGVIAALNDLQYFNRAQKIFVFKEIIELGERADEDHVRIAAVAAKTADYVMLLPSTHQKLMRDAMAEQGMDKSRILGADDIASLKELCDTNAVVLCEGRDAQKIMVQLL